MFRVMFAAVLTILVGLAGTAGVWAADSDSPGDKHAKPEKTGPAGTAGRDDAKAGHVPDVVYVPTPHDIVTKMLDLGGVKHGEVLYDLGCGDGRIVVAAAKRGAKSTGFEISPARIKEANANVRKAKVEKLAAIEDRDIFTVDLKPASVVTMYLLPKLNERLIPQLDKLKPGSRIVVKDYDIPGVKYDKEQTVVSKEDNHTHYLFLYVTPLKKIGAKVEALPGHE
jgi:SAM-dependent methyltransferase